MPRSPISSDSEQATRQTAYVVAMRRELAMAERLAKLCQEIRETSSVNADGAEALRTTAWCDMDYCPCDGSCEEPEATTWAQASARPPLPWRPL